MLVVLALVVAMALTGLVATSTPGRATHETVGWSDPLNLAYGSADEDYSTVLTDGNGHVYVFYLVTTGVGFTNVSVAKWTTMGPFGVPQLLFTRQVTSDPTNARTAYRFSRPSATIDHTGNLYVAWTKQSGYTGGRGSEVYVSKSVDAGNSWLPAVLASSPTGFGTDQDPSMGTAPNGTLWLSWTQYFGGWYNITTSFSSTAGGSFNGFNNVTSPAGRFYANALPDLYVAGTGRVYIAYSHQALDGYFYVNVTWSDTGSVWATRQVSTAQTFAYYPSIASEASGRVHVAWWDNRFAPTGGTTIWYRQSPDGGNTWYPEVLVAPGSGTGSVVLDRPNVNLLGKNLVVTYGALANGLTSLGYVISADDGQTWYPGAAQSFEYSVAQVSSAMDENGTVWAGLTNTRFGSNNLDLVFWNGPPSTPTLASVTRGTGSLTVAWSAPPEKDVVSYRVWRSTDGLSYQAIATITAPATAYTDGGLADGVYWYRVTAVDNFGTSSHGSDAMSGTVGPTTAELIADLQAQIDALQSQLADAQANLSDVQAQLAALQAQLTALQNSEAASDAATAAALASLQQQLNTLRNQLNATRAEQATQTTSYLNLVLGLVIIALLVFILLTQMRRPRQPMQFMAPAPPTQVSTQPPSTPQTPEDEL